MKRLIILASLLTICVFSVFSQNKENHLAELLKNFQYQQASEYIEAQEPTKELLFQKALCNKALGEYQKAIFILELLDKEYKDDVQILSELATCYQAIANRKASVECYDELIRIDSANIYFKIQKAELLFQQSKYEKALELFYVIYDQGKSANTLKQIAQCYEMMNVVDSAIFYYRKTLAENPLDAFSTASLTNIYLQYGLLNEGKECSQTFMDMDTTNHQVNLLNALLYYAGENYEEANNRFLVCEQRGDTSLLLNRNLGLSYFMSNKFYNSEVYLDKAFRQDTTNNTVLFALATSSMQMADHKKAIPLFNRLLDRLKPDSSILYSCNKNLALSYEKSGQYKEAAEAHLRSLNYSKYNQMNIYYTVANIYDDRLDDPQNALTYYTYYRNALSDYVESLKKKTEDDDNVRRIKDSEKRIKALDEHILELKKGKKNSRKKQSQPIVIEKDNTKMTISKENGKAIITKEENGKITVLEEKDLKIN
ncbi:tetratricopeptide repeat protein [Dysgonomonas reticulitermitis]